MADVFISYAHQDSELVRELGPALEAEGYSVWYYEDKSAVGASYLRQIDQEIERCQAVLVLVSPDSVESDQVSKEVVRAHEARKKFLPVRAGITHAEFQQRQPEWRMAFGAAVSAEVPPEGAAPIVARLVNGLRSLGVDPGAPPALPAARAASFPAVRVGSAGVFAAAIVGGLGLLYTLYQLSKILAPTPGTPEAWLFATFPTFKTVTSFINLAGVFQNALLLYGAWQVSRRNPRGAPMVRTVALSMLATVGLWLLVSLSTFMGAQARAAIPDPANRSGLVQGTIFTALLALVPAGIVFWLFRGVRKKR